MHRTGKNPKQKTNKKQQQRQEIHKKKRIQNGNKQETTMDTGGYINRTYLNTKTNLVQQQ